MLHFTNHAHHGYNFKFHEFTQFYIGPQGFIFGRGGENTHARNAMFYQILPSNVRQDMHALLRTELWIPSVKAEFLANHFLTGSDVLGGGN